jgi:ribosomal protein L11 methyltransferase
MALAVHLSAETLRRKDLSSSISKQLMQNYLEIEIEASTEELKGILIAGLTELGFEGYEEEMQSLKAYIAADQFNESDLKEFINDKSCTYKIVEIESKNWNEAWESSFEPVVVNDFCAIRASFHKPVPGVKHEIVITPKMSFGTGHHATTYMMLMSMEHIRFVDKQVFDFGTGTGVLAILAEKLGAAQVDAIDNDDWSIENATDNIAANHCKSIHLVKKDNLHGYAQYDIILANINRNIILQSLAQMKMHLKEGGNIFLSGLLNADFADVHELALSVHLNLNNMVERHNWICLHYVNEPKFA